MPNRHARFSPSSADRYIHCTPSLRLGEEHGPPDTGSVFTAEGTEAHELGEFLLRTALGEKMEDPRPGMKFYNDEMQECAEGYRDAVLDIYNQLQLRCQDAAIFIEQEVSISRREMSVWRYSSSSCFCAGIEAFKNHYLCDVVG